MEAHEVWKAYWDANHAIHDALCLGCVELADMLREERDLLASELGDER